MRPVKLHLSVPFLLFFVFFLFPLFAHLSAYGFLFNNNDDGTVTGGFLTNVRNGTNSTETAKDAELVKKYGLRALFNSITPTTVGSSVLHTVECRSLLARYADDIRAASEKTIPKTALCARLRRPLCDECKTTVDLAVTLIESTECQSRSPECKGPFIMSFGGPGTSGVQSLWASWRDKKNRFVAKGYTLVSFDHRTVGFSGPEKQFCGEDASTAEAKQRDLIGNMYSKILLKEGFETQLKEHLLESRENAMVWAQSCKESMGGSEGILEHMGLWERAGDMAAVADNVWTLYKSGSAHPLTVYGASADGPLVELIAFRNAHRLCSVVSDSGSDLLAITNHTRYFIDGGSDGLAVFNMYASYCAISEICYLRDDFSGDEVESRHAVLQRLRMLFSEKFANHLMPKICDLFIVNSCYAGTGFRYIDHILQNTVPHPSIQFEEDEWDRIIPAHQYWSTVEQGTSLQGDQSLGHSPHGEQRLASYDLSEGAVFPVSSSPHLLTCVDTQDFGIPLDAESFLKAFREAQRLSPFHAHGYFPNWIICEAFLRLGIRSKVPVPVSSMTQSPPSHNQPILFIANDRDPTTPRRFSEAATKRYATSALVYQEDVLGHVVVGSSQGTSACMRSILNDFLTSGTLPTVGTCPVELPPAKILPFEATTAPKDVFNWPNLPDYRRHDDGDETAELPSTDMEQLGVTGY
ncbi:hypothetical protein BJ508DRAFT_313492 [Ascobolus immersus RN42]|uniref:Peptidase S33 tripeptidyl aminopeptidase-like C-terminal domain-containing protein n=1 Tax=Ascobolus immersus RN42 TaxID=1160509 RepID=A0A3N4HIM6_ASCIM|nr:hypothetical protein BJ508DRAFT_313492 [Ascobolus immersus RN42]